MEERSEPHLLFVFLDHCPAEVNAEAVVVAPDDPEHCDAYHRPP